jgi:PAS domain S-box-containing protein
MTVGVGESAKVLLVDDSPAKLLTLEVMLAGLGANLLKANSAIDAFQLLLKSDVALILTDVSMPTMNGLEFAKMVRSHPRFSSTPIIFVSALAQSELDQLQGYASGAVDYVNVPVAAELLRAKIRVFLELHRKQRELELLKAGLEHRVAERTSQLESSNSRLAQSEARYRILVENASDIVSMLDLDFRFVAVNPAIERILGYTPEEIVGTSLSQYVPEGQLAMHTLLLKQKLAGEESARHEMQLFSKDRGRLFTLEVISKLVLDEQGKPIGIHSIARNITERKEAEARQVVLMRELQHRTRNLLAVIQSIATSTLTRSEDLTSAHEALVGRLHALAHAQEFVASGPGGGVPLRNLIDAELSAFGARAQIRGEPLVVGGPFAQTFALIVHELATNAAKHGSLSVARGHIVIDWRIDRSEAARLTFWWRERGGPAPRPSERHGMGMQLLNAYQTAHLAFNEEGFEYRLELPLAEAIRGIS